MYNGSCSESAVRCVKYADFSGAVAAWVQSTFGGVGGRVACARLRALGCIMVAA